MFCSEGQPTKGNLDRQRSAAKLPEYLKDLYQASVGNLIQAQQMQVYDLLRDFSDVFSQGSYDLSRTDVVQYRIDTEETSPIRQLPRRLLLAKQQEAAKAVEEMDKDRVI